MTISTEDIKTLAIQTKSYVEKNHKLPTSLTVSGKKYSYPVIGYIFAKAINNIEKEIKTIKVEKAKNNKGETVNLKINKEDYKDLAKRLSNFIDKNGRLPNYVKYKDKKIKQRVFIYSLAKIIVYYYANNKTLPKHCKFKTSQTVAKKTKNTVTKIKEKVSKKLHKYLTKKGCSGMGQCTGYYCGCNSLQQCFYRLTGIKVSEKKIASVAGTTTSGTDHEGLNTAVAWFNKKYNQNIKITWKNFSDLGSSDTERWKALKKHIKNGAVFVHLLYRNRWGHYEVPKSVGDNNLSILNSLGNSCGNGTYCGYIETRSKSEQKSYINGISQKSIAILTKG